MCSPQASASTSVSGNMFALDLVPSAKEYASAIAEAATRNIVFGARPLQSIRALDMITGDMLQHHNDMLVEAFDTWSNTNDMPKWDCYPQIEEIRTTGAYDPYPCGISDITQDKTKTSFRDWEEIDIIDSWKQLIYCCDFLPHILVIAPKCPLVVLTPAITDREKDYKTQICNRPPDAADEDWRLLRGGYELQEKMAHDHQERVLRTQDRILLDVPGCPVIILTPDNSDPIEIEQIRNMNRPLESSDEDKNFLRGGCELRAKLLARNRDITRPQRRLDRVRWELKYLERKEQERVRSKELYDQLRAEDGRRN